MRGRSNRTAKKRETILAVLAEGRTVGEAARLAGLSRRSIYDWRSCDPAFDRDCADAFDDGTDRLEGLARNRAIPQRHGRFAHYFPPSGRPGLSA